MPPVGPRFSDHEIYAALISEDIGIANPQFVSCNYSKETRGYPPRGASMRRQGEISLKINEGTEIGYFQTGPKKNNMLDEV